MDADILVFDYDNIKSNSDYVGFGDPNASPDGINQVIVGGTIVKDSDNMIMNRHSGTLIKRK